MSVFECVDLCKSYGKKEALRNVNLKLDAGKIVALLGPNGSGKTTMIKLANGLLTPTHGKVLINGMEPGIETKARVAYLPDREFLPDYMTTAQLIEYYSDFFEDFNINKSMEMLNNLDIDLNMNLRKMSKGTKEKVQLILTMGRDAEIYLLDEPIAGVDPAARDYIMETIISNYNPNGLVIISTHLIADIEAALDEVVFIKDGEIVMHEEVESIREERGTSIDGLFREVFKCHS